MKEIILASTSPRRKEILKEIVTNFTVQSKNVVEISHKTIPQEVVVELATIKARATYELNKNAIVIGADTLVEINGEIFGKPHSINQAKEMLQALSNQTHNVFTGICVICNDRENVYAECSKVTFYKLTDKQIEDYIATSSPFDKAGAYGIQDSGFVKQITGSYSNVLGLPKESLSLLLSSLQEENK
ncbi:MAG: Maf family protein [Clostridia bacterium]